MYDFVICGAQKCGTTSLHYYLSQVPDIILPEVKEVPYYCNDELFGNTRILNDYLGRHYYSSQGLHGLTYVNICFFHQKSIPRILADAPDAKFIMLVREPITRAASAYLYAMARGWEHVTDYAQAFDPLRRETLVHYAELANLTYVQHSMYGDQIAGMLRYIAQERLLILHMDDLRHSPISVMRRVLDFIGGSPQYASELDYTPQNTAKSVRFPVLQRLLLQPGILKKSYHHLMPGSLRRLLNRTITRPLEEWNLQSYAPPPSPTSVNEYLEFNFGELFANDARWWAPSVERI